MQHLSEIKGTEFLPGFTGRFVHGAQSTLSFVDIKQGCSLPEHQHPHEQITHIVEGELEMIIGGEKFIFTPGTVHVIPSNVPHSAYAITDCKVIDAFSPARDDYRFE
jgi:quercetin dioxygenase-like cupin family protein